MSQLETLASFLTETVKLLQLEEELKARKAKLNLSLKEVGISANLAPTPAAQDPTATPVSAPASAPPSPPQPASLRERMYRYLAEHGPCSRTRLLKGLGASAHVKMTRYTDQNPFPIVLQKNGTFIIGDGATPPDPWVQGTPRPRVSHRIRQRTGEPVAIRCKKFMMNLKGAYVDVETIATATGILLATVKSQMNQWTLLDSRLEKTHRDGAVVYRYNP